MARRSTLIKGVLIDISESTDAGGIEVTCNFAAGDVPLAANTPRRESVYTVSI
jgi:hypothetical protein